MDCEELFHPILDSAAMADLLLQHQLEDLDRFLSLEEEEEEDGDKPQVSASTVSNASVSSSSRITGSPQVQPLGPPAEDDKPIKRRKTTSSSNDSKRSRGKKPKLEAPASASALAGFIHVRARRGEATDSHSLAERARRGKISERMRVLQSLVPGCDKIKGKQLVLDEIINYVQSLQNQIEFLSTKIASLSGVLHALGIDSGDCMNQLTLEETTMRMNMPQLMPSSEGEINPCFFTEI